LVLDPYMGSGPLAQACFQTGRKYIGVEWEEGYCQIAKKRLEQDILIPSP
jgi:site-specific DNA-methyltransferase (adenine-specific)